MLSQTYDPLDELFGESPVLPHPSRVPASSAFLSIALHPPNPENTASNEIFEDQQASQWLEVQQQIPLSPSPTTAETPKKRPRSTLTKTMIHQLNEAFAYYEQQPSNHRCYLTQLAKALKIGYSTVLRKYGEFKVHSYVQEGKRLTEYPKQYSKSRLARCLIYRTLKEVSELQKSKDICRCILEKYGFYYNCELINKQLRRTGIKKGRNKLYSLQKGRKEYLCDQCLLQCLTKMPIKMVYLGEIRLVFQNQGEATIVMLASNFGVAIQILQDQPTLYHIKILIQQFWRLFQAHLESHWYLVTNEGSIYWNSPDLNKKKVFLSNLLPLSPKMIMLGSSYPRISPVCHLLKQISFKLQATTLTRSQAMAALPEWLSTQQASAQFYISQAEKSLSTVPHSCPA